MKPFLFSLLVTAVLFSLSIHNAEAREETGRTTWTNPTTNKTYIKVSYDDNYFALVDDGVLWNTAYLYNPEGQEVASKSNTSLEYTIKFVKESDSDGLIYRGEEIKKGNPLWGTTKNVADILTTPVPTLVEQVFDGPDSFEKNSQTTAPSSNASPQIPLSPTSQNVPLLDQIVPPGMFGGSDQPLNSVLNQLFYVGLVAAVILAIVMIIRGGVEYMTIDAITSKENGKNRVKAALGGLLLAFSAILILNTINPGLTKLTLVFTPLEQINSVTLVDATIMRAVNSYTPITDAQYAEMLRTGKIPAGLSPAAQKILAEALNSVGTLKTGAIPGTDAGNKACAAAVNKMIEAATGQPVGGGLSTAGMYTALQNNPRFVLIPGGTQNAQPGDIIISPSSNGATGHAGIVATAGAGVIISNSSSQAQVLSNQTATKWNSYYGGKGLATYIYRPL